MDMKLRIGLIFAAVGVALALLFVFSGKRGGTVVVVDVAQVLTRPANYRDRELRVRGFIKPGSISRYGEKADFVLMYEKHELKVHFDGSTQLPDTFGDGAPARADGKLNADMQLQSGKVEAKCASKYDAQGLEHSGKGKQHPYAPPETGVGTGRGNSGEL